MIVFDTNIMIDMSNNHPLAHSLFNNADDVFISVVSRAEFMVGVDEKDWTTASAYLNDTYKIIHTDDVIADIAARYRRQYRLKMMDALIYATATSLGLPLITRNSKDFNDQMPGLQIAYGE